MAKMPKPDQVYPNNIKQSPSPMPPYISDPSIYKQSFDQLLKNRGIRMIHRKAIPCPNMSSLNSNSHSPNCSICDNNGMYYYEEKEIYGVFHSNNIEKNFEQQGLWEIGTAVVTLPSEYEDGTQAEFNTYDQLIIPDFTVRLWELKEYEDRAGGQQMRYPINNVEYISSVENGSLVTYIDGTDFQVTNNKLEWIGNTPGYDSAVDMGSIFNIMYFANPVYTVMTQMRELRISQQWIAGEKVAIRMPQQILVKRDFLANSSETES